MAECKNMAEWLVAFGTISAVIVALFGKAIHSKLYPPKLNIKLLNPAGEKAKVKLTSPDGKERMADARYYHLQAYNERRWSPAHQVQLFLVRIESFGPDGALQIKWAGDVPLNWRHQEVFPIARIIGPKADCDFISIVKDKWLQLHPLINPFNLDVIYREETSFVATLQARSNECDSPALRIKVSWDGGWHDGDLEMQNHLKVQVID